MREQSIGKMALFLVPSLKLKEAGEGGARLEDRIHRYLLDNFGGYTAAGGNIFGYWKDDGGRETYGEHKEYKVGVLSDDRIPELKRFLAQLAAEMHEECVYLETGREAWFIYASQGGAPQEG